jgi:hypothetical protein
MSLLRSEERRAAEQRDARRTVEESEARRAEAQRSEAQRTTRRAEDVEDATIKAEIKADQAKADLKAQELRDEAPTQPPATAADDSRPAPLFGARAAQEFREQWDATQIGFVDNPRRAVQRADELVTEAMKALTQSVADERARLDAQINGDQASTEHLRLALQRYRAFFQRLLSL